VRHDVQWVRDALADELRFGDRNPDGTIELVGVSFTADEETIFGPVNEDYIQRELDWYDRQSLNVNDIPGGPPPIWQRVSSQPQEQPLGRLRPGTINSNYGFLLYHRENGSQYTNVLEKLVRDPSTRQAVAVYTRPSIHQDAVRDGMSDFICTNTVQYLIRDSELHVIVQMRSNDAIFGYRNDYAWQRTVQERLGNDLAERDVFVTEGTITWQVGSLHVYPRHMHLVERYAESGDFLGSLVKDA
jgi:thymidylate synthase